MSAYAFNEDKSKKILVPKTEILYSHTYICTLQAGQTVYQEEIENAIPNFDEVLSKTSMFEVLYDALPDDLTYRDGDCDYNQILLSPMTWEGVGHLYNARVNGGNAVDVQLWTDSTRKNKLRIYKYNSAVAYDFNFAVGIRFHGISI